MTQLEKLPQLHLKEISGILFPVTFTQQRIDEILEATVRQDDIFVASYPKSGTTWAQELVWEILHNGKQDKRTLEDRFPWYEAGPWPEGSKTFIDNSLAQAAMDAMSSPRLMKTHLPFHLMPKQISETPDGPISCKCIYVMRNPKDAAVSLYHMLFAMVTAKYDGTWQQFLPLWMAGRVTYGSWFDHVLGWWSHRDDPNILFLKYEDMKKDLPSTIRKIAEFLEKQLTTEMVELIAEQCTFGAMKSNPATDFHQIEAVYKPDAPRFMRKGKIGDWKNYFTDEQNENFDKQYLKKMEGRELKFDWE